MQEIYAIQDHCGQSVEIGHSLGKPFIDVAEHEDLDCFIISAEDGFSPFGKEKRFLANALGYEASELSSYAKRIMREEDKVSIIVLPAKRVESKLKGIVLAAAETSRCYERYSVPFYGKPYRDFYYAVTYQALEAATRYLHAKNIGISHLSGSGNFHRDIGFCNVEALTHFARGNSNSMIRKFVFVGCCINPDCLTDIGGYFSSKPLGVYRYMPSSIRELDGVIQVDFDAV